MFDTDTITDRHAHLQRHRNPSHETPEQLALCHELQRLVLTSYYRDSHGLLHEIEPLRVTREMKGE